MCVRGPGVSGGPGVPFAVTRGARPLRLGRGQDGALRSSVTRLRPGHTGLCLSPGAQGWSLTVETFLGAALGLHTQLCSEAPSTVPTCPKSPGESPMGELSGRRGKILAPHEEGHPWMVSSPLMGVQEEV